MTPLWTLVKGNQSLDQRANQWERMTEIWCVCVYRQLCLLCNVSNRVDNYLVNESVCSVLTLFNPQCPAVLIICMCISMTGAAVEVSQLQIVWSERPGQAWLIRSASVRSFSKKRTIPIISGHFSSHNLPFFFWPNFCFDACLNVSFSHERNKGH